jgi:ATP-binding cassette, subfamily C (CFTR/MRP), member 1
MQEKQMKVTDHRTRLMSELLNNIKSTKLYNWESFFMSRILSVRNDQELKLLRQLGIMTVGRINVNFSGYQSSR